MSGAMAQSDPLSDATSQLLEHLALDQLGLFAGAGISQSLSYPGWGALVESLGQLAFPDENSKNSISGDNLLAVDLYRQTVGIDRFGTFLRDKFAAEKARPPVSDSALMRALIQLDFPFYVTTNYDFSLEDAFRIHGNGELPHIGRGKSSEISEFIQGNLKACLHWHGDLLNPQTVILAEQDYKRLYFKSSEERLLIRSLFYMKRFLFVGFSMEDTDLMYILRELTATIDQKPRHFAILGYDPRSPNAELNRATREAQLRERYSINPIFYRIKRKGERHRELSHLLEHLANERTRLIKRRNSQKSIVASSINPDDKQKGKWGGLAERSGYKLSSNVSRIGQSDWFSVDLTVDGPTIVSGEVAFHLHQSFATPLRSVPLQNGQATLSLRSHGAFTVGAEVRPNGGGRRVKLELDLAEDEGSPEPFRSR
jgi:hypothetical protein